MVFCVTSLSSIRYVLKEAEQPSVGNSAVSAAAGTAYSGTNEAAVGQLIDFDADTPSPAPTTAMANLCMSLIAEQFCCFSHQLIVIIMKLNK